MSKNDTLCSTAKLPLVGTSEFILEVKHVAIDVRNVSPSHPILARAGFGRSVISLLTNGQVPYTRIRGRMYVDPALAPRAADLLGLTTYTPAVAA